MAKIAATITPTPMTLRIMIIPPRQTGRGRPPRRPPIAQCRPPLSHRCVQLFRHILLFPEQLSAQCCLQIAGSKASAGTDQTTRLSKATTETSLDIVASLWRLPGHSHWLPPAVNSTRKGTAVKSKSGHCGFQKQPLGLGAGRYPHPRKTTYKVI
jgi:hypothetical protein